MLNYAGQALVLEGAPTTDNFFNPPFMLVPLVLLATIATIIASQSIITGAYSMTQQAIQLGWLPRLQTRIRSDCLAHTRVANARRDLFEAMTQGPQSGEDFHSIGRRDRPNAPL